MPTISFISANFVARAVGYSGQFGHDWGKYDQATLAAASPEHFEAIARDIADAGFRAIDIWTAHCHWQHHGIGPYANQVKAICRKYGLTVTSFAGGLSGRSAEQLEEQFRFFKELGAPVFGGAMHGPDAPRMAPVADEICRRLDMRWAFENHPEKTPQEILEKIDGGRHERVGVALDTGWCGTQGMDALEAAKRLRHKLFMVHMKDVKAAGAHDTCALGDGIVPVEQVTRFLVESGWQGTIAIEHEPYDRDPMPEIRLSRRRLIEWLG